MPQPLPTPVGPQEVGIHGHITVEHEEESGVVHSCSRTVGLVDWDPKPKDSTTCSSSSDRTGSTPTHCPHDGEGGESNCLRLQME